MENIRELIEMHRMNYLWKDTTEGSPLIQAKIEALEELLHELPANEQPLQGLLQEWMGFVLSGKDAEALYASHFDLVERTQAALHPQQEEKQS